MQIISSHPALVLVIFRSVHVCVAAVQYVGNHIGAVNLREVHRNDSKKKKICVCVCDGSE